jgi:hypothetical protein
MIKMFLAQNLKKFLKNTFQSSEDFNNKESNFFNRIEEIEKDCGLDPNNTATAPAFKYLEGNVWQFALGDD